MAVPARADLIGHWTFDDAPATNAGIAADNSGPPVRDGEIFTTLPDASVTGKIGKALDFTKSGSDYVKVDLDTSFVTGVGAATIAFWMNPDTMAGQNFVFAWGNNSAGQNVRVTVETAAGGTVLRQRHQGGFVEYDAAAMTADSGWHHVAAVVPDGLDISAMVNDVIFYLDGVPATKLVPDNDTLNVRAGTGGTNVFLGSNWNGATAFDGQIDDVGWWNEALSADDIKAIYDGGLLGNDLQQALSGAPAASFKITEIQYDADTDQVTLKFNGRKGQNYEIWGSHDLTTWYEVDDGVINTGDDTEISFSDFNAAERQNFYQMREPL